MRKVAIKSVHRFSCDFSCAGHPDDVDRPENGYIGDQQSTIGSQIFRRRSNYV